MRRPALIILAVLIACGPSGKKVEGPSAAGPLTAAQIAERALPSVVLIEVVRHDGERGLGTGFVIWADGRIATSRHVIAGAEFAVVTLHDGRKFSDVEVSSEDEAHDLAIIRVAARGLPVLVLADSDKVKPGETVVAIGHPLGLGNTVSDGLVSSVRDLGPDLKVLQISAPISPGSSGGPLFNDRAEVIGVAFRSSQVGEVQNLNFGVPSNYLKPMLIDERREPIAKFGLRTGAPPPQLRPSVPIHDVTMLDDCAADQQELLYLLINKAISLGAPLFNKGDKQGCFEIYEDTAKDLISTLNACKGAKAALQDGINNAAATDPKDWDKKAWSMRDAFDGLLYVIERRVGR